MKVLSLKEPFATLILTNKKQVETRSWKTNYRGEIYIHASISKISKEVLNRQELMNLVNLNNLHYSEIICKCTLIDCIYMTKEYVENMKKNNYQEYICGEYKEGRYAWLLKDIEPIKTIKAKGSLGIWEYYNAKEVMELMENIEYGWVDNNNEKHLIVDETYSKKYRLQFPKEVIKNKIGVCWDQVELERFYFKNNPSIKTFFIVYDDNDKCPTHTFLTYEENNKLYWFEHSWEIFRGIHEYKSLNLLLRDVKDKFIKNELNGKYKKENLFIHEYSKPKGHISVQDFYSHCRSENKYTEIFFD